LPLPRWMKEGMALLPRVPAGKERSPIPPGIYEPQGTQRAEVALFTGCMMETLFGRVNRAALRVLQAAGCRVHVPADQGCCGALHLHAGLRERARPLVERNLRAFGENLDAIILTSAGCGSAMKEYPSWMDEASTFSSKVQDFTEFLVGLGLGFDPKAVPMQATWDDPCHLCHGQGIRKEPRQLLAQIPGLELVPLERPEDCCGSAGIYSLQQPALARSILARKVEDIQNTGVRTLITANPGCHLWTLSGLRALGEEYQVLHIAEVLARAL
ncbi:MAG TPA: (Fe-S)-binding protein, partial [Planctomycetes bacterium]|nr:(Fe-S)-binding protein [Planctomycetota bacterium]